MRYRFLVETYASERDKTLAMWSEFSDADLPVRPRPADSGDARGRSVLEHLVHQCVSENAWFVKMLGIDVGAPPLPAEESRLGFLRRYAVDSAGRLAALETRDDAWWEEEVAFFDVRRSRAWVVVRRIAHTAHHRGQQSALLRMLGRSLHSNYGPTADTGGLPASGGRTLYAYPTVEALLEGEAGGGAKAALPAAGAAPVTERPDRR